jgi:uncharacterized protein
VFATNVRDLLLAAPAGQRPTIGLDPGFRTGVKVAVTDATGKVVDTATIYPHEPHGRWDESLKVLTALAAKHKAELVAIGNGTASRETDRLATDLIKRNPALELTKVLVSEAGASVYSASAYASSELPCHCAVPCRSRAGCRTRSPNSSRSTRSPSASASTSTTSPIPSCPGRWTPWSRTA